MHSFYYQTWRAFFIVVFKLFYRYQAIGVDNIPDEGPVLLCANHISLLDPPIVGMQTKREVVFMAKQELLDMPVVGTIVRSLNAFPVKRGAQDRAALKRAMQTLQDGDVLLMFPEGTRMKSGNVHKVGKGHTGAGLLSLKLRCAVVPVAVIGPYRLFRKTKVVIGPPVQLDDLRGEHVNRELAQAASDRIIERIQMLIDKHLERP